MEKSGIPPAVQDAAAKKPLPVRAMSWIGQHELAVILAFALIVGGLLFTVELADGVAEGDTEAVDMALLMMLREGSDADNPLGPPWLEEMMRDFTALGGTGILLLVVTAVTVYYLLLGRYKEMLVMITAVLGAYLLSYYLKELFGRPRPQFVSEGVYEYTASFPSGHALLAATVYLTIASIVSQIMRPNRLKAFVLLLGFSVMILVGFTRVYLGVHWPTDVLAGWVIGAVWAAVIWLVFRWLRRQQALDDPHP